MGKNISDYLIPGREGLIKPTCKDRIHTVEDEQSALGRG